MIIWWCLSWYFKYWRVAKCHYKSCVLHSFCRSNNQFDVVADNESTRCPQQTPCAPCTTHTRLSIQKSALRKDFSKCFRLRSAPKACKHTRNSFEQVSWCAMKLWDVRRMMWLAGGSAFMLKSVIARSETHMPAKYPNSISKHLNTSKNIIYIKKL